MEDNQHLSILWTTNDPVTAQKMVLMYAKNSLLKGWWKKVTLIIWGASTQLVNTDPAIQDAIRDLLANEVHVTACKRCADELGATPQLEALGIEVKYWGEPLTEVLKSDAKFISI